MQKKEAQGDSEDLPEDFVAKFEDIKLDCLKVIFCL
jgi:hypothetical protein